MTDTNQINSILARLNDLEATRCRCSSCAADAHARKVQSSQLAAARVLALPARERNAELSAMTDGDRNALVRQLGRAAVKVIADAPPECRARWAVPLTAIERNLVRLELTELPERVTVTAHRDVTIPGYAVQLDADQARDLRAVGLSVVDNAYQHDRREVPMRQLLTRPQLDAVIAIDPVFRARILEGVVLVATLSDAENRAVQLDLWNSEIGDADDNSIRNERTRGGAVQRVAAMPRSPA